MKDIHGHYTRRGKWVLALFIVATIFFFGAGIYAVSSGVDRDTTAKVSREDMCREVQELRDDVVKALDILTDNSQEKQVQDARDQIKSPKCP